jgi:nitric oxide reductase large subunit
MDSNAQAVNLVVVVTMLVLSILSIVGFVYVSQYAYQSDDAGDDVHCHKFSDNQMMVIKITVGLIWFQIALGMIAGVHRLANR